MEEEEVVGTLSSPNMQRFSSCRAGETALLQLKFWLAYFLISYAIEKRIATAIALTIGINFAATSLPYLLPLANPLRYRHPLARVTITVAVIYGIMVLLSAR